MYIFSKLRSTKVQIYKEQHGRVGSTLSSNTENPDSILVQGDKSIQNN
jgi:hypothetical protein